MSRVVSCLCLLWCGSLLLPIAGCGPGSSSEQSTTVVILGAASTKDALQEMADAAQQVLGEDIQIEISTGPSHALAQQILSGAPADIYISANQKWADELVAAGLTEDSTAWLANALVLIVPKSSSQKVTTLEDLTNDSVQRVAIAGQNVPAGIYAQQALAYHKLWEPLDAAGKIVRGHDVRSTLAYAQRGEVDAAVVYSTDARLTDQVTVVAQFDPASHDQIVYPLVRVQTPEPSEAADRVYAFLQSERAQTIAKKYGFVPLTSSEKGE
ncbi:molybdate ABC transporter substrate-binding protein [Bremerella sp. JC817]|uniref:molybdate ABC transporter substrate-binding protein n=1 Tax=Bremerella sp. JC817 TaxID=3231756 RepID=UPI003459A55A